MSIEISYLSTLRNTCLSGISRSIFLCLFVVSRRWEKSHIYYHRYFSVYLLFLDVEKNLISITIDISLFICCFSTLRKISYLLPSIFLCLFVVSRRWEKSHIYYHRYFSVYLLFLDVEKNLISITIDISLFICCFSTLRKISYLLPSIFLCLTGISRRWENLISINIDISLFNWYFTTLRKISYLLTSIFLCLFGISRRWEKSHIY